MLFLKEFLNKPRAHHLTLDISHCYENTVLKSPVQANTLCSSYGLSVTFSTLFSYIYTLYFTKLPTQTAFQKLSPMLIKKMPKNDTTFQKYTR